MINFGLDCFMCIIWFIGLTLVFGGYFVNGFDKNDLDPDYDGEPLIAILIGYVPQIP